LRTVIETKCCDCGIPVRATDDDVYPLCETCQGLHAKMMLIRSVLAGEMKHIYPLLFPEFAEGGDDDE